MTTVGPDFPQWRASTSCEGGACLEVAYLREAIAVRSSPSSPVLVFGIPSWHAFIAAAKSGDFDIQR